MGAQPLERLRSLRASGRLESDYPRVAPLLAELFDGPDGPAERFSALFRAGRVLSAIDTDRVLLHHPDTPVVSVAVTGHGTVAHLLDPLTTELARHGMLARVQFSDHGAYLRDLTDPHSAFRTCGAELALCVLDAEILFDQLPLPWGIKDLEAVTTSTLHQLSALADRYSEDTPATLVLNTVPLLRHHTQQLIDRRGRALLGAVLRDFNAGLLRLAARSPSVEVLDLDPLIAEGGPACDARLARYLKAAYTDPLLAGYAREVGHLARSLRGMAKKCLVLDLDNTLWDGVLGDQGPEGIAAAGTYRGEAFGEFQRTVKQLASQGVLLAVSSKNDRAPVLEVLREHPDMVLREADFVRVNASRDTKDGNIRQIADDLDCGVECLVFADDSAAERALVRHRLPQIAVVPLDEEPALHVTRLLQDGWFDTRLPTEEDGRRPDRYRVEEVRREALEETGSPEEHARELEVKVWMRPPDTLELARLSQLTLRTDQLNLAGARLRLPDITALADDPRHLLLSIRSADRFGENGMVGALFLRPDQGQMHIDNILLSCRVAGRGIERACLSALLEYSRAAGLRSVTATYRVTSKNRQVRELFPELGFREVRDDDNGVHYRHDLDVIPPVPEHLRIDSRFEGLVRQ